jgi:hypothetical protein
MWMIEVDETIYKSWQKAIADLELLKTTNEELVEKNKELWSNIIKAKDELKTKHSKALLEETTQKEKLENEVKLFKEKLWITDEVENIEEYLDEISSDTTAYKEIKAEQEKVTQEQVKTYTDFLNEKDAEYLTKKAEVFWESILTNPKALEDLAIAQGYKPEWKENIPPIKVWELKGWETPGTYDSFTQAEAKWDLQWMTESFFGK